PGRLERIEGVAALGVGDDQRAARSGLLGRGRRLTRGGRGSRRGGRAGGLGRRRGGGRLGLAGVWRRGRPGARAAAAAGGDRDSCRAQTGGEGTEEEAAARRSAALGWLVCWSVLVRHVRTPPFGCPNSPLAARSTTAP